MLVITDAEARRFADSLAEREYSPATISKYAHDLRLLMDYAPDGIPDKAALVGFRAYLTERGYCPTSVNSILGAVNVFFELSGLDWRLKYLPIQRKLYLDADKELSHKEYERIPAENAWHPLDADGYMHIDCLWVSGSLKGHGYSNDLLCECVRDAKEQEKKGLCILSSAKKKGFLADPKYLAFCGAQRQPVWSPTAAVRRSAAAGMLRGPQRPLVRWPTAAERW